MGCSLADGYVVINESLTFQPNYQQLLAFKTELDLAGELYYFGGHWFPEEIDHYLGVKFQDSDLEVHYGWVRCDIKESGRILIIKDYAYETEIEHPIVAGDTLSYLGVDNTQNMLDAIVYSSEKSIYIHLPSNNETFISILDITGKELVKKELQNCSEIINMSIFPYGLYLVNITQNDKSMIKRVLIQ